MKTKEANCIKNLTKLKQKLITGSTNLKEKFARLLVNIKKKEIIAKK